MSDEGPVLTPTESRQASPRRLNFRVLVGSMVLAVVVAAILYYAVYSRHTPLSLPEEPPATSDAAPDNSAPATPAAPAPATPPPANQ